MVIKCIYCEAPLQERKARLHRGELSMGPSEPMASKATIDHIIPVSRGGNDDLKNKVWCCQKCNSFKSNLMPEEFVEYLKLVRIKGDMKFLRSKIERMLINAQDLVMTITSYRSELFILGTVIQRPILCMPAAPYDCPVPSIEEFVEKLGRKYPHILEILRKENSDLLTWVYFTFIKKQS